MFKLFPRSVDLDLCSLSSSCAAGTSRDHLSVVASTRLVQSGQALIPSKASFSPHRSARSNMSQASILTFFSKGNAKHSSSGSSTSSRKRARAVSVDVAAAAEVNPVQQVVAAAHDREQLRPDDPEQQVPGGTDQEQGAELADGDLQDNDDSSDEEAGTDEISEFEQQRLCNMARNAAFLASLGLDASKPAPLRSTAAKKNSTKKKKTAAATASSTRAPARRSTRLSATDAAPCYDENQLHVTGGGETSSAKVCASDVKLYVPTCNCSVIVVNR